MSEPHVSTEDQHEPRVYEIRFKGQLDPRWAGRFDGWSLSHGSEGTTILSGLIVDQAALYGLLRKVRDLGLPLLSVMEVETAQADMPNSNTDTDHKNKETNT